VITAVSADGTTVRAFDEGRGPAIVIVHPGLDDGRSWAKVARLLAPRFRIIRLVRRHYRLDLPAPASYSVGREAEDVIALARLTDGPVLLVGHSSGGVVALEALAAAPGSFAGAVVFEPPVTLPPPPPGRLPAAAAVPGLAGDDAHRRAGAAAAAGRPGRAAQIFVRDVVGMPPVSAWLLRPVVASSPRLRALMGRQLSDLDGVGFRMDAYARIAVPVVLLGGGKSPAHLGVSLGALAGVLPDARTVILPGRDHQAQVKAPAEVARVIAELAGRVLPSDGATEAARGK
jgi:pimeloyl-ACP methyl ester carboxylesterase